MAVARVVWKHQRASGPPEDATSSNRVSSGEVHETQRKLTLAGLRSAHGVLQRAVANQLRLKHTPQLVFAYDDTADRAARVEQLLREADSGD